MFWKIAVFAGIFGIVLSIAILAFSILTIASESTDETTKDFGVGGFIFGVVLLLGSILLTGLAIIFVMRGSKREFDAQKQ